jgi:hypothetical protein
MNRKWYGGAVAAIGGLCAAAALMAGQSAARADEVSDLRANQQLLQQRIDQLEQVALGAPRGTSPGAPSLAGSFPRSFLIPGTDTSIAVGGYVKLDATYWFSGGPTNGNVATPVIGENGQALAAPVNVGNKVVGGILAKLLPSAGGQIVGRSRSNSIMQMTARESRLRVETRTPTAWGPAGTVFEFDWLGCNNLSCNALNHVSNNYLPRLRLAYGTLGPWLAGQAFGTTDDLQANPETLDFGGPVGEWGVVRLAQLRYTGQLPWGGSFAVAAEQPATDIYTPVGAVQTDTSTSGPVDGVGTPLAVNPTKSSMPDWAGYLQWNQPWGHFRVQGVLRDLKIDDSHFLHREFLGYGGGFAGDVHPGWLGWSKDDIQFQFGAGIGMGRYMNSGSSVSLATNFGAAGTLAADGTAISSAAIQVQEVPAFFGAVGYQHWWLPNLRSTAAYGIQHQDIKSALIGQNQSAFFANKEVQTVHVNLIWSPVAFIDTGIEYIFARRRTVGNLKGEENVLETMAKVKF